MMKILFLLSMAVILLSQCAQNKFKISYERQRDAYVVRPDNTNSLIEFPRDNMNSKEKTGSYFSVKSTKNDSHEIVFLSNEKDIVGIIVLENLYAKGDNEIDPLSVEVTTLNNEKICIDEVKRVTISNKNPSISK